MTTYKKYCYNPECRTQFETTNSRAKACSESCIQKMKYKRKKLLEAYSFIEGIENSLIGRKVDFLLQVLSEILGFQIPYEFISRKNVIDMKDIIQKANSLRETEVKNKQFKEYIDNLVYELPNLPPPILTKPKIKLENIISYVNNNELAKKLRYKTIEHFKKMNNGRYIPTQMFTKNIEETLEMLSKEMLGNGETVNETTLTQKYFEYLKDKKDFQHDE